MDDRFEEFVSKYWPTVRFLLTAHGYREATTRNIFDVIWASYQDEVNAFFEERDTQIKGRTVNAIELKPVYLLAVSRIVSDVPAKAKEAMRATINTAVANYETWDEDRLIGQIARDWLVAYDEGYGRMIKRMDLITSQDKSWYSAFLRPYGIMYFFYSVGKILVRDYILAGAQTVLQYAAFSAPASWRPAIRTAINAVDSISNLTERLHMVWMVAKRQVAYGVWTLLTGPLALAAPFVALAGASFVFGMMLGEIIFSPMARAAGLPEKDESKMSAIPPELLNQLQKEATGLGDRINALYTSIKNLDDWSKAGGGIPYADPAGMLDDLESKVNDLTASTGQEYVDMVKKFLKDYIGRVRKQVANMKVGGADADVSLMDRVDMFDVYRLLLPYFEQAFKEEKVDPDDSKAVEDLITRVIREHHEVLEAYGRDLAFQERNSEMPKGVMAGYEAADLIENLANLVRANVDIRFIVDGLDRLRELSAAIDDPQHRSMVESSIQMFDEYVQKAKSKEAAGGG